MAAIGNNQRRTPPSIPASFLSTSRRAVPTPPLHPSSCTASWKPGAAGLPLRKEANMEGAPLALPPEAAGSRTGSAGRAHLRPGSLSAAPTWRAAGAASPHPERGKGQRERCPLPAASPRCPHCPRERRRRCREAPRPRGPLGAL